MAPSRKSKRVKAETPVEWKLPADLLHEILASTDLRTIVRCAATCKLLRRDILSRPLDRRITQAAPCILAYLCTDATNPFATDTKKPLTLVHPSTPTASSFCQGHLSRFMSQNAGTLLGEYEPVASRRGLFVLRRMSMGDRPEADRCFDMCVYDPMSGSRSFFPDLPEIGSDMYYNDYMYVLLTAADGIDTSSFLLLAFDINGSSIIVHTVSSSGIWESVTCGSNHDNCFPWWSLKMRGDPTILSGGVVHWLSCSGNRIISYDLGTTKMSSVMLPSIKCNDANKLHLTTSSDNKRLKLLAIEDFMMFVWLQLPLSATGGSGWSLEIVIDMKEKLQSLDPRVTGGPNGHIKFEGFGNRTGEVVFLLEVRRLGYVDFHSDALIVFDLETKKMHRRRRGSWLLEIDLPSRLKTMKIFS